MLKQMLQSAQESYVSMASSYIPNDEEKKDLKQFCELHVTIKSLKDELKNISKPILLDNKSKKEELKQFLKVNELDIVKIKDDKYLRLTKTTKSLPITFDLLREAFQAFDEEKLNDVKLEDEEMSGSEAFVQGIVNELKLMTKAITENVIVSNSLPRGKNGDDVRKATQDVNKVAQVFVDNSLKLKSIRSDSREEMKEKTHDLEKVKINVDNYLQKANVSAQQISYNEIPFSLTKKVSVKKPKINIKVIEEYLLDCCKSFATQSQSSITKKRSRTAIPTNKLFFIEHKKEILQNLEEKLLSLPQEQTSNIYLKKVKKSQDKDEEDDDTQLGTQVSDEE